jgi:hypothetical protein
VLALCIMSGDDTPRLTEKDWFRLSGADGL